MASKSLIDRIYAYGYSVSVCRKVLGELMGAEIGGPSQDALIGTAHPQFITLRQLFSSIADKNPNPIFVPFKHGILEVPAGAGIIDVSDCYGVTANKSALCPFRLLAPRVNLDEWPNPQRRNNREDLVEAVFFGTYDYVAPAHRDMDVRRQAWNDCYWIVNSGGGHRAAGLWQHYRAIDLPLERQSSITDLVIAPEIYGACDENSYWLFTAKPGYRFDNYWPTFDGQSTRSAFGIQDVSVPYVGLDNTYCIGWRRGMPFENVAQYLREKGALDLSQAIQDGFRDYVLTDTGNSERTAS